MRFRLLEQDTPQAAGVDVYHGSMEEDQRLSADRHPSRTPDRPGCQIPDGDIDARVGNHMDAGVAVRPDGQITLIHEATVGHDLPFAPCETVLAVVLEALPADAVVAPVDQPGVEAAMMDVPAGAVLIRTLEVETRTVLLLLVEAGHNQPPRVYQQIGIQMVAQDLSKILQRVDLGDGADVRIRYERVLRSATVIGGHETLADHPEIAVDVYRDWQRRPPVACVFARLMALNPEPYDIAWEVVPGLIALGDAKETARRIADLVEPAIGQEEAIAVLIPGVETPESLIGICKALGHCPDWTTRAPFNPSDKFERRYIRITTVVAPDVEAEVLGVAPFDFLPITRRSPIFALHVRTKAEGAKDRGQGASKRVHLADIAWPEERTHHKDQFWGQTIRHRLERLGGDNSAARARITLAIPRKLWDAVDVAE